MLDYQAGAVTFGSGVTAASLGGLKGGQPLALVNADTAAVTLSVSNAVAAEYSGSISGAGASLRAERR